MTHLPGEEWLAKQEPVLRGRLSKAIQSFVAIVGPLLILASGMPVIQKAVASGFYLLSMLCLWLLSWLAIYRTKVRQLETEKAASASSQKHPDEEISDLEFSLLSLIYDRYPERFTRDELEQKSGAPRVEVDHALASMMRRTPKLIFSPTGGLWREGQPNPAGLRISTDGMGYVKNRRSEPVDVTAETRG